MTNETKNLELMQECDQFTKWQYDKIKPFIKQGPLLEVGCGRGNLTEFLIRPGYCGIDINPEHVTYCNKKYRKCFYILDIEKQCPAYFRGKYETIILCNVIEHIKDDQRAMNNIYRMLKKGGNLIIMAPFGKWLYGTIDKSDNHYRRYNKKQLKDVCELTSFKVIHTEPFNFFACAGWYLHGKILKLDQHKTQDLKTFNKIVPLLRAYEDYFWVPFGLSLIMVAKRE